MPRSVKTRGALDVNPRVKLWLESRGESVFCHGLRDMLHAVEETGSIKEAAVRVGRSYRFVWARIKEAEDALGATLVQTRVGGAGAQRSELTPLALSLVSDFDELSQKVYRLVDGEFTNRLRATLRQGRRKR